MLVGDRVKKNILMLLLLFMVFTINISNVEAKTLQDMYNELSSLKNKLATANSDKKLTESEISNLKAEISTITVNISKAQSDIKKAENDIIESQNEIESKKEECNQMLQLLQLSSDENTYLEYVFEADSYTELIYRYAVVSQLTDYNSGIMDELTSLIDELEEKKIELSNKQQSLEKEQANLSDKLTTLNANLKEQTEEGASIEDDIAYLERQIKYYKDTLGCSMNQNITTCGKKSSSGVAVTADGWTAPLKSGCVSSEYVGYGDRLDYSGPTTGHHAIDLACNAEGTPVYAAAAGEVDKVVKYSGGYSCGGNMVYIYHTVNGKNYTTVYMHLLSIAVSEHQIVDENTVIGYVGGGSTAKQNGGYDSCTTGAHLHFGMATGHHSTGFNSYSFNPRTIFNFPAIGGGYFYR